ncbi:unnamed protein product [marine sediment metagenome]|uniref:Uncharacterized protein n=1 Tax=marine sediment metagenome TaxID=412755 RepID=X0RZU5_9ZZZZ
MKQTKKSLMEWGKKVDISMEIHRTYVFSGGDEVIIQNPEYLIVSNNGHRIADSNNIAHYIPYGWIHLYWENKDKESFQFNHQRPGQLSDAMPYVEKRR